MALRSSNNEESKKLMLENDNLKTNGALVSIQPPSGWYVSTTSKLVHPDLPKETFFLFKDAAESKSVIGVYFSGIVLDDANAFARKEHIFSEPLSLKSGTEEAKKPVSETGPRRRITQLGHVIMRAVPHPVLSDEKYCLAAISTEFKDMKCVMFEFLNEDLGTKTVEYCIDVLGDGRVVYFLYYLAPINAFAEGIDHAVNTFKTSVWRTDFDPMVSLDVIS